MKYVCYTMIMLITLYLAKAIQVNYGLKTIPKDYSNDPCLNSSDGAKAIKWKSEYSKDMIDFDSEFTKIVLGKKTDLFYVSVQLFGKRVTSDRAVVGKLDHNFTNLFWSYGKVGLSKLGSFMCVDEGEANLYMFHKDTSSLNNQIIVLDPAGGKPIRVKSIELEVDFEITSSEASNNSMLYFSAMSSRKAYLCNDRSNDVTIKCSVIPFLGLNSNVLNSLDVMHSIQTVFNDTSIILSVSTSYNYLNSSVTTYDYDLNPISNRLINCPYFDNPLSSIKLFSKLDSLLYFITDNTNYIHLLTVYPDQRYDLHKFKIFDDGYGVITAINDQIKHHCYEWYYDDGSYSFRCYFSLVYDYTNSARSENSNSTKSTSNKSNQQSYSGLFQVQIVVNCYSSNDCLVYFDNRYNYKDRLLKKKVKTIVLDKDNFLYLAGSYANHTSTDSWYFKMYLDQYEYYSSKNYIMFDIAYVYVEKISSGIFISISSINETIIGLNTYEKDIESSTFNSSINPQNYLLSPYSFNRSTEHPKILKNIDSNTTSSNATFTLPVFCDNTNYNYTLEEYSYNISISSSVSSHYDGYPYAYCNDHGNCTISKNILKNVVINKEFYVVYEIDFVDRQNKTIDSYSKEFSVELIGCTVDRCQKCKINDIDTCEVCEQNYVDKKNQCHQIYDEWIFELFMFSIMCLTFALLFLYIVLAIFKPCLWILVVLIIENTQIIALLTITNSFQYLIYWYYSAIIGFIPGFFSILYNMNIFDSYSYDPFCGVSFLFVFNDYFSDYYDEYDDEDFYDKGYSEYDANCVQNALLSSSCILSAMLVIMMILIMIFCKFHQISKAIKRIYGYLSFRLLNIIMFPTFMACLIVFELEYLGAIHHEAFQMTIHIAFLLVIVCYYFLQIRSLIYNIFFPSNSILFFTTSIDTRYELSARLYQAILALRKLIFAILIVYGRNKNQVLVYFLLLSFQTLWLAYCIKFFPLKYRFANLACCVNEITLAVLFLWTLLKVANILKRESYYVYIQAMLRFPLGMIFIFLYYIAIKIEKGCLRRIRLRIFPYKFPFRFQLQRLEVDDQFGKFNKYDDDNSQSKDENQANSKSKGTRFTSEKRSSIN